MKSVFDYYLVRVCLEEKRNSRGHLELLALLQIRRESVHAVVADVDDDDVDVDDEKSRMQEIDGCCDFPDHEQQEEE